MSEDYTELEQILTDYANNSVDIVGVDTNTRRCVTHELVVTTSFLFGSKTQCFDWWKQIIGAHIFAAKSIKHEGARIPINPQVRIYWRKKPEITEQNQMRMLYARFKITTKEV